MFLFSTTLIPSYVYICMRSCFLQFSRCWLYCDSFIIWVRCSSWHIFFSLFSKSNILMIIFYEFYENMSYYLTFRLKVCFLCIRWWWLNFYQTGFVFIVLESFYLNDICFINHQLRNSSVDFILQFITYGEFIAFSAMFRLILKNIGEQCLTVTVFLFKKKKLLNVTNKNIGIFFQ